jgi:ABC-2 type transport system permease protein
MNRMLTIMRKDFIHIMRDSLTLGLVIIMPVFMLFLLGYAVSNDITDIPLAVADQSKTDASRRFIESFVVSDYFEATHYAQTEDEIIQLIDDGSVKAIGRRNDQSIQFTRDSD